MFEPRINAGTADLLYPRNLRQDPDGTTKPPLITIQWSKLKNGLRLVVLENHKVPTFTMQMVILSGGLADLSQQHGLASFTAAMLTEGNTKRTSREISE